MQYVGAMRRAVCPGSFDPIHNGHLEVIARAANLFDEVIVAVSTNYAKKYRFALEERLTMARRTLGAISGILGAFALSFGQQKEIVKSRSLNRMLNAAWLLAAWIVLQIMTGMLGGFQGVLVATPAHVGGFISGLLLQRPLLMWRYRKA